MNEQLTIAQMIANNIPKASHSLPKHTKNMLTRHKMSEPNAKINLVLCNSQRNQANNTKAGHTTTGSWVPVDNSNNLPLITHNQNNY